MELLKTERLNMLDDMTLASGLNHDDLPTNLDLIVSGGQVYGLKT